MGSWKDYRPGQLKKPVYAMTETKLKQLIKSHEDRGWTLGSDIKPHGYGLGCLMVWKQ